MNNHHSQDNRFSLSGFLSGIVLGGLAGTTLMLLTAPQSGKRTRALIRQKSYDLRDQATETLDEAQQRAENIIRRARLKARRLQHSAETAVEDLRQRGQGLVAEQMDRRG